LERNLEMVAVGAFAWRETLKWLKYSNLIIKLNKAVNSFYISEIYNSIKQPKQRVRFCFLVC